MTGRRQHYFTQPGDAVRHEPRVTGSNTQRIGEHHVCTEASTIGLAPGAWPRELTTDLGNGHPFVMIEPQVTDGGGYAYRQRAGILLLTVFND